MNKKRIIYMDNEYCLHRREYFAFGNGKATGYHRPEYATLFDTVKEAKEFQNKLDMPTKIGLYGDEIKRTASTDWKYREINMVDPVLNLKYDKGSMGDLDVLDWWIKYSESYIENGDGTVRSEVYQSYPQLWSIFSHLHDTAVYSKSDYTERYMTFSISTRRDSDFETFKKELDLVLDKITYTSDEGFKIFPIFDKDLNEFSQRSLHYKDDGTCKIVDGYFDADSTYTLKECFERMKRDYWYE